MNPTTAYRTGILSRKEYEIMHAERNAGDRIEDLSECGMRYERDFDDLRIQSYAFPRPVGKGISWGLNSLVTGFNTKRGIVG